MIKITVETDDEESYKMWKKAVDKGAIRLFDHAWFIHTITFHPKYAVTASLIDPALKLEDFTS